MHEITCPTDDCPYITLNKKIIINRQFNQRSKPALLTHRQRVFFREDIKEKLRDVFMTQSEQDNCKFEPATASLKPQMLKNPEIQKIVNAESDHTTYFKKHGDNFTKTHPEVFKSGKLKKAKLEAKDGLYEKALSTLSEGFNLTSLQARFDPTYLTKKKFIKDLMHKIKEKREHSVESKKAATDVSIAHMKEEVKDKQKEMP